VAVRIPVNRCGAGGDHKARAVVVAWALVDDRDAHLAAHFWTLSNGYVRRSGPDRKNVMLHHSIIGKPPPGWHTSHADADKLNCRRSNLSHVTHSQNFLNIRDPLLRNNTSGERGLDFDANTRSRNKWRGKVVVRGVVHHTSRCVSAEEASAAMKELRERLGVLVPVEVTP
jgi:hypothetical protein